MVAGLDAGQLALGGLQWGPVGGVVIYLVLAAGLAAGRREAAWMTVVMPWVPLLAVLAWAVGLSSLAPHVMMGVVALVQLLAGAAAAQALDLQ